MTDLATIDADTLHLGSTLAQWQEALPALSYPPRIEWQRHGLAAVHARIEHLKQEHAYLVTQDETAARIQGRIRALLVELRGQHDDVVGERIETEVSTMAARGMAADERRIAHDTRALPITIRRRRLEQLLPLAEAHARNIATRLYAIRDERQDLRVQLRAIDLGVELGEL